MTKIYCDICGKEIDENEALENGSSFFEDEERIKKAVPYRIRMAQTGTGYVSYDPMQLCYNCTKNLSNEVEKRVAYLQKKAIK